jgi:hypothetical protein
MQAIVGHRNAAFISRNEKEVSVPTTFQKLGLYIDPRRNPNATVESASRGLETKTSV